MKGFVIRAIAVGLLVAGVIYLMVSRCGGPSVQVCLEDCVSTLNQYCVDSGMEWERVKALNHPSLCAALCGKKR